MKQGIILLLIVFISTAYADIDINSEVDKTQLETIEVDGVKATVGYIPRTGSKKKGAVIIIQGAEQQLYQWDVVNYLRHNLPLHGYSTLGLAIPGIATANAPPVNKQIKKAIKLLQQKKEKVIFVLLYGSGAGELISYFIKHQINKTTGLVLLSAYSDDDKHYQLFREKKALWQLNVLDIKAQYDYNQVHRDVEIREGLFSQLPTYYRAKEIAGSTHDYQNSLPIVLQWLRGGFKRHKTTVHQSKNR